MQADCEVGIVNADGLRGVVATHDMHKNQIVVKLPKVLAVDLKESSKTAEVGRTQPLCM